MLNEEEKKLFTGQDEQHEKESGISGEIRETGKAGEGTEKIEEEFGGTLEIEEEISSFPGRRRSLFFKLTALFVTIIFTALVLGSFLKIFTLPSLDFLAESQKISRDPLVQELKQAVACITAVPGGRADPFSRQQRGTGFNINPEGLIVTNRHLVEEADSLVVSFPGREECRVAGWTIDPIFDLALITLESGSFPFVDLERKMLPVVGDRVIIIGNPLNFNRVAVHGEITGCWESAHSPAPILEIDAPIYKGSSGSPVFNAEGKVVAIIYATVEGPEEEDLRGLALPVALLEDYIESTGKK